MFQSQRTQKKLEKDVANRQAQEEKLQVKYYPIVLDGELLIMQISSFPSVRGFSSLGMICRGSNALALTKIQPGFRVQNINFSPPFQRKILIIAFVTGFCKNVHTQGLNLNESGKLYTCNELKRKHLLNSFLRFAKTVNQTAILCYLYSP